MFSKGSLIQHLKRRQFIRQLTAMGGLAAFGGLSSGGAVWADSITRIAAVRGSFSNTKSRLVFDLDGPIQHSLFTLRKPDRVVIDIENALIGAEIPQVADQGVIRSIRSGYRDGRNLRIVLDLDDAARAQSFLLKPQGEYGYRLVVDLTSAGHMTAQAQAKANDKPNPDLRDVVIAIDPGHGGRDPGAIGRLGTREKDITLAIGTRLTNALQGAQGLRPVLLRKNDKFMHLRDRMDLAHQSRADLLVSLHADAYHDSRARGASVYALSLRGASSEAAKWVADKENAADLIGGISIRDKDDLVATVILDLAQTATIQSSLEIGSHLLDNLHALGRVHKSEVQQAGFAVLKNPDIPSVLIETAFISNPQEERKLRNSAYQDKMSKALLKGISRYFKHKAPPGTLLSALQQEQISS